MKNRLSQHFLLIFAIIGIDYLDDCGGLL
jgi:hypothetical protein